LIDIKAVEETLEICPTPLFIYFWSGDGI